MEKAVIFKDIQRTTGNKAVFVKQLDTSSLTSVRRFADQILAEETRIDVLILNAGIAGLDDRNLTADGLEYTMATNHFGHFLLTNILLGRIKESKPSRVVVVSSDSLAETVKIDTEVQGAQTIIYLAAAEETGKIAGKFFEDCKISSTADALLRDEDLAKQVWEASESLVSLQPNEKHY